MLGMIWCWRNTSTQPFPSGCRTNAGDDPMSRKAIVDQVLAAVIMPEANACRGMGTEAVAVLAHRLPDWLQGLEPGGR